MNLICEKDYPSVKVQRLDFQCPGAFTMIFCVANSQFSQKNSIQLAPTGIFVVGYC